MVYKTWHKDLCCDKQTFIFTLDSFILGVIGSFILHLLLGLFGMKFEIVGIGDARQIWSVCNHLCAVGIYPNDFGVLNGHPNKIPTNEMLGGVA